MAAVHLDGGPATVDRQLGARILNELGHMTPISVAQLDRELQGVCHDDRFRDAPRDEAPSAYKPFDKVMRVQKELTRVVRRLRPVLSYKGG